MSFVPFGSNSPSPTFDGLSDKQWQSRCLAWMMGLSPSIEAAEAGKLICAASTVATFRRMAPEDAAERLLADPIVRL